MSLPDQVLEWLDADPENIRIWNAALNGAIAGALGLSLRERAKELGYKDRTPKGDAFEEAYLYAVSRAGNQKKEKIPMEPEQKLVCRILDEAAGMFSPHIGGPGFWRYVHEVATIEGIKIFETGIGPHPHSTLISFQVGEKELSVEWVSPQ